MVLNAVYCGQKLAAGTISCTQTHGLLQDPEIIQMLSTNAAVNN